MLNGINLQLEQQRVQALVIYQLLKSLNKIVQNFQ